MCFCERDDVHHLLSFIVHFLTACWLYFLNLFGTQLVMPEMVCALLEKKKLQFSRFMVFYFVGSLFLLFRLSSIIKVA